MKLGTDLPGGNSKLYQSRESLYDNYIALDWSMDNVCIAQMRAASKYPTVVQLVSSVDGIKEYSKRLRGKSILCFEETTGSHWLYVELRDYFDEIVVCDPYRNGLLSEGAKTDKIDAAKLCQLLRSNLIKPVYHSLEKAYELRKLVNCYLKWTKIGAQLKNQMSALYRSVGKRYKKEPLIGETEIEQKIYSFHEDAIDLFNRRKKEYQDMFSEIVRKNAVILNLKGITGIGNIFAAIIYSSVVEASRFPNKYHYWSYCGLVKHIKESGGSSYGRRYGRYSRKLKWVYTSAAMFAISHVNDIRTYYEWLLQKGYSTDLAKHEVARYIAKSTWAMMKNNSPYEPYSWRKNNREK